MGSKGIAGQNLWVGKGCQGGRAMEGVVEPEHAHSSRVIGGLGTTTCTTFGSVILRIGLYPREHEWSLLLTDPSEIEMSDEEGTGQLSEEVIQAVEERILKKLQAQLEAQHKVKEGGR